MIALEGLGVLDIGRKGAEASPLRVKAPKEPKPITLVTMGCPLTHLYAYYFPGKYKINKQSQSLVARWFNIYRADDFVGRDVKNTAEPQFPLNLKVGPRGHTNYWADLEVLGYLINPTHSIL